MEKGGQGESILTFYENLAEIQETFPIRPKNSLEKKNPNPKRKLNN
jgi:hypothetical protein